MSQATCRAAREDELVWQSFNCRTDGFFVEVGANEPQKGSQTWFLEQQGWQGILIEPQGALCSRLSAQRPRSKVVQAACGAPGHPPEMPFHIASVSSKSSLMKNLVEATTTYVQTEMVKIRTLDEVLAAMGNPHLDFVSIDVEGTQLDVLHGFDLKRYSPGLLLMEDHLHRLDVHCYIKKQGYRLVKRTGLNNWYIPLHHPFGLSSTIERVRLWKKVWGNTPFRKWRVHRERRRAIRNQHHPISHAHQNY